MKEDKIKKKKVYNYKDKVFKIKFSDIVILFLVFILISLAGVTFARFQTSINGKVISKIAKPILEVDKEESLVLTALAPNASYSFDVRNYNEEEINDVQMEYYIEILPHDKELVSYELYKDDNKIEINDFKTDKIELNSENKEVHKYRLDITYNENTDNLMKENSEHKIEIKIHSVQKM